MRNRVIYWVVATVPVDVLDLVRERFETVGIVRFTAAEVEVLDPESTGTASQGTAVGLGAESGSMDSVHCMRVEVAVNEEFLTPTITVLEDLTSEGKRIDFHVGELKDARRIRTGESGPEAI